MSLGLSSPAFGPQPPPGHGTHHYHFHLFALDVPALDLPESCAAEDGLAAIQDHVLDEVDVIGDREDRRLRFERAVTAAAAGRLQEWDLRRNIGVHHRRQQK